MKHLLESGVHFGHQTRRWNPKMKKYIFGERNGIYILDLKKTVRLLKDAYLFVRKITEDGGAVLFVGTKRQAQEAVLEEAKRCGAFYVVQRWLGGTLTNFQTIQKSIQRLKELEAMEQDGRLQLFAKMEQLELMRQKARLLRYLGGIQEMQRLPQVLFVADVRKDHIAVAEAHKIGIPVVAIVDTNCDPDMVTHVIPANDDAIRAIRLMTAKIADAVIEGRMIAEAKGRGESIEQYQTDDGIEDLDIDESSYAYGDSVRPAAFNA